MSNKQQTAKNFDLTEKLIQYLGKNPKSANEFSQKTSFVVFSAKDKKLNSLNEKLLKSLVREGNNVVKAEEPIRKKTNWTFTPISI